MKTQLWLVVMFTLGMAQVSRGELLVGGATVSITPDRPIALWGQMNTRISREVESPVTATIVALETQAEGKSREQTVLVACDLVAVPKIALEKIRERVGKSLKDFPLQKIIVSATHTHTGPVLTEGVYEIPKEGVMQPTEYIDFFADRVAEGIVSAWNSRKPGSVGWGMAHAVIAQNRRAVYNDGTAVMYGKTDGPTFRMFEGYEDHAVDVLCFWGGNGKLLATAINVPCPAQEVEGRSAVNADFWHQVREKIRAEHGAQVHVLGWTGAAGDQSPHLMFRKRAEERMMRLRGLDRLNEIARRIVAAWKEAYEGAKQEKHTDVPLVHHSEVLELPRREVTKREWEVAKSKIAELSQKKGAQTLLHWHGGVVERYERQQAGKVEPYTMELHVVRLGDVVIATNPFEMYTDYGMQIKTRSPAVQTFVIQLTGPGTYLPSQRAVIGGGYNAVAESNEVGPEGGQILVDRTVERMLGLWKGK
ncbi:MAG: hypothetical protein U0903_10505 [Planctomycetales bacterium]